MTGDCPSILVIGAGLVGKRHAERVAANPRCRLAAIVDPQPAAEELAAALDVPCFQSVDAVPAGLGEGAIVATPNHTHLALALVCKERKWHCLMEKPIADDATGAEEIIAAFDSSGVQLLVGHHRRYHPFVEEARRIISEQLLGRVVAASIDWRVRKPDSYFDAGPWRLSGSGGPIMINLIHEVDLLRYVVGDIRSVYAMSGNVERGGMVEDSAAIIAETESGALVTVSLSDAALSPWCFEGGSGENPTIATTEQPSWRISCTDGSLEFAPLRIWQNADTAFRGDWTKPLEVSVPVLPQVRPLDAQLTHFIDLINGAVTDPLVSGREALQSLAATQMILRSAKTGQRILMEPERMQDREVGAKA